MMKLASFKFAALLLACCVGGAPQPSQAAEEWRASRTWITGADGQAWVVGAADIPGEESLPILQMWQANVQADKPIVPKQTRFLPAVAGSPLFLGADSAGLRLIFSDLSTWSYFADRDASPWRNWRDQSNAPPLAWVGDTGEPAVWALVRASTLFPERPRGPATQSTTAPRPGDPVDSEGDAPSADAPHAEGPRAGGSSATSDASPTSLMLLQCHNGVWQRIQVLKDAESGTVFWMAARQGEAHLFWQTDAQGVFAASLSRDGTWSSTTRVGVEGDVRAAWVGVCELGPVFIAGIAGEASSSGRDSVQVLLHLRDADGWSAPRRVSEGPEYLALDPSNACVSVAANRLIVSRPTATGAVEFGVADLGISPSVRFSSLDIRQELTGNEMTWLEMISLVLMLSLMTLIFVTRREQMARPAIPPRGFVLAAIWRRLLATTIDFIPAVLLSTPIWLAWYGDKAMAMDWQALTEPSMEPADLIRIQVVQLVAIFFYGVWCCAWELAIRTTPGKLLFGCRVAGALGQRPTTRQILVRNAIRVVVFALGQPGLIVTLMTMVLVSRSRQRLGDILADTIVIEPEPPVERMQDRGGPPS